MVDVHVRKGSTAMADSNTQFRFILAFVPFPLFFRFGGSDGQDTGSHSYTSLQDTGSYSTKWKKVAFGDSRHGPGRHTMLSKVQGLLRSGSSVHWAVVYCGFSRKRPGAGRRGHVQKLYCELCPYHRKKVRGFHRLAGPLKDGFEDSEGAKCWVNFDRYREIYHAGAKIRLREHLQAEKRLER